MEKVNEHRRAYHYAQSGICLMSDFTYEKLREMVDRIGPPPGGYVNDLLRIRPLSFAGMDVYEAPPPAPVLQISPDFPHVSDEFRANWNAWALERFGYREPLLPRNMVFQIGHRLVVNRQSIVQLMNCTA